MKDTKIQWCDGTINPIMGCGGCELYPKPKQVLDAIDRVQIANATPGWRAGTARRLFRGLLAEAWQQLLDAIGTPGRGHINALTLTNIYHLCKRFGTLVKTTYGREAGALGRDVVERSLKCYAAQLHLNRGYSIVNPHRKPNKGYAATFEQITQFEGRMRDAARWSDLLGEDREDHPWLNGLPRLIFVSDMGDALTRVGDFAFLRREVEAIQSDAGMRHLWLWLTKRPERMQRFAASIGGMPSNVCAMTTVTSNDVLDRVDMLRQTDAMVRGLSVEPLWAPIADYLDLTGIDWLIVGGESGAMQHAAPFCVEWVEDLRDLCAEQDIAFFCKQLGRRPTRNGEAISLDDRHGCDWDEWDEALSIRKMPAYFHEYRQEENAELLG